MKTCQTVSPTEWGHRTGWPHPRPHLGLPSGSCSCSTPPGPQKRPCGDRVCPASPGLVAGSCPGPVGIPRRHGGSAPFLPGRWEPTSNRTPPAPAQDTPRQGRAGRHGALSGVPAARAPAAGGWGRPAGGWERAARSYLVESREVQPEAQLGHGEGATAAEGAPDGGGRLPQDGGGAGPLSARPHLHVGLVTASAHFP